MRKHRWIPFVVWILSMDYAQSLNNNVSNHLGTDREEIKKQLLTESQYSLLGGSGREKRETRRDNHTFNENGEVMGTYSIRLPDGRKKTLRYIANERGFIVRVITNDIEKEAPNSHVQFDDDYEYEELVKTSAGYGRRHKDKNRWKENGENDEEGDDAEGDVEGEDDIDDEINDDEGSENNDTEGSETTDDESGEVNDDESGEGNGGEVGEDEESEDGETNEDVGGETKDDQGGESIDDVGSGANDDNDDEINNDGGGEANNNEGTEGNVDGDDAESNEADGAEVVEGDDFEGGEGNDDDGDEAIADADGELKGGGPAKDANNFNLEGESIVDDDDNFSKNTSLDSNKPSSKGTPKADVSSTAKSTFLKTINNGYFSQGNRPLSGNPAPTLDDAVSPKNGTFRKKDAFPLQKEVSTPHSSNHSSSVNLNSSLPKNGATVLILDSPVSKKDATVPKKDAPVSKKDGLVPKKDKLVPKKDELVPKKDEHVPKKDEHVPKKDELAPKKYVHVLKNEAPVPKKDSSSEDNSPSSKDDASSTKEDASLSKDDASSSKDDASSSKHVASLSKDDASLSKGDASLSKDDASLSKEDASSSKDNTSSSKRDVSLPKDDASLSKNYASSSKGDASLSKDDVSSSKDDTSSSKKDASLSKDDASLSKDDASLSKDDVSLSKDDASSSKDDTSSSNGDASSAKNATPAPKKKATFSKNGVSSNQNHVSSSKIDAPPIEDNESTLEKDDSAFEQDQNSSVGDRPKLRNTSENSKYTTKHDRHFDKEDVSSFEEEKASAKQNTNKHFLKETPSVEGELRRNRTKSSSKNNVYLEGGSLTTDDNVEAHKSASKLESFSNRGKHSSIKNNATKTKDYQDGLKREEMRRKGGTGVPQSRFNHKWESKRIMVARKEDSKKTEEDVEAEFLQRLNRRKQREKSAVDVELKIKHKLPEDTWPPKSLSKSLTEAKKVQAKPLNTGIRVEFIPATISSKYNEGSNGSVPKISGEREKQEKPKKKQAASAEETTKKVVPKNLAKSKSWRNAWWREQEQKLRPTHRHLMKDDHAGTFKSTTDIKPDPVEGLDAMELKEDYQEDVSDDYESGEVNEDELGDQVMWHESENNEVPKRQSKWRKPRKKSGQESSENKTAGILENGNQMSTKKKTDIGLTEDDLLQKEQNVKAKSKQAEKAWRQQNEEIEKVKSERVGKEENEDMAKKPNVAIPEKHKEAKLNENVLKELGNRTSSEQIKKVARRPQGKLSTKYFGDSWKRMNHSRQKGIQGRGSKNHDDSNGDRTNETFSSKQTDSQTRLTQTDTRPLHGTEVSDYSRKEQVTARGGAQSHGEKKKDPDLVYLKQLQMPEILRLGKGTRRHSIDEGTKRKTADSKGKDGGSRERLKMLRKSLEVLKMLQPVGEEGNSDEKKEKKSGKEEKSKIKKKMGNDEAQKSDRNYQNGEEENQKADKGYQKEGKKDQKGEDRKDQKGHTEDQKRGNKEEEQSGANMVAESGVEVDKESDLKEEESDSKEAEGVDKEEDEATDEDEKENEGAEEVDDDDELGEGDKEEACVFQGTRRKSARHYIPF